MDGERNLEVSPIPNRPVLDMIGTKKLICAGDLHIGLENEMKVRGVHVPSQTFRMEQELVSLAKGHDGLVLLGDIKHRVPGSSKQEYAEIPHFFQELKKAYGEVHIVRGNHDTNLEAMLPEGIEVHPATGFTIDDVGFVHGHTWPSPEVMSKKILIMAHNHPAVVFEDNLHTNQTERCWVRCRFRESANQRYLELPDEVIIVPALNRNLGGSPINFEEPKLLGPFFSQDLIDLDEARVYLMDGVYLGKVGDLKVKRRRFFKLRNDEL
jgi:putative SbcD/Mre11-related phosphoesterase